MKKSYFFVLAICLFSCAGTNYPYYVISPIDNKLLGKEPKDDLPLDKVCTPTIGNNAPCIAQMNDVFFKQKQELLELRKALDECQRGPLPSEH